MDQNTYADMSVDLVDLLLRAVEAGIDIAELLSHSLGVAARELGGVYELVKRGGSWETAAMLQLVGRVDLPGW